jgi:2-succinyl-5-enolpyruvyl-6-hydroxy-3-cyclohexene-1-carboxylate synthase
MEKPSIRVGNRNMEQKYYTDERNVQIMIALLKAHGIRKVIASPGTTNMTFVGSIQNDPFFEIYSSVDERSAAYMACGMAEESGEPVVLSCTGATASRNYMPGLTEAFYRKLPVLAITSHRGDYQIGHLKDQQIDRRSRPNDIVVESVVIPLVKDETDERYCVIEANKAILALTMNGGGPAHVNMYTKYSKNFTIKEIAPVRVIHRHTTTSVWPQFPKGKTAIFCGVHHEFTHQQTLAIDAFCATYDAVVFSSHISGYHGKYKINWALVMGQRHKPSYLCDIDTLIQIGEIPGDTYHGFKPKRVWRVSEDGALRDMYGKLTDVFQSSEETFFQYYTKNISIPLNNYYKSCKEEYKKIYSLIPELPFGNIWIAQQFAPSLPDNCEIHFGILNSLRSWSFFDIPPLVIGKSNVGGYGIDGGLSTLIGASLANPSKLFFGVFGDLAFFYDMNVLGNRHVGSNVRIILVNNGKGAEFRNYGHPCYSYGEAADLYMSAAGHYGNKSTELIKHFSSDLGFEYLFASTKEELLSVKERFLSSESTNQPMLLEVFTDGCNESDALKQILNLLKDEKGTPNTNLKRKVFLIAKELIDKDKIGKINDIIRKKQ